jgi:hypothetical protein
VFAALTALAAALLLASAHNPRIHFPSDCAELTKGDARFLLQTGRSIAADSAAVGIRTQVGISPWMRDSVVIVTDSATCADMRQKVIAASTALGKTIVFPWPLAGVARIGPTEYLVDFRLDDGGLRWYFVARSNSSTVTWGGLR